VFREGGVPIFLQAADPLGRTRSFSPSGTCWKTAPLRLCAQGRAYAELIRMDVLRDAREKTPEKRRSVTLTGECSW